MHDTSQFSYRKAESGVEFSDIFLHGRSYCIIASLTTPKSIGLLKKFESYLW